MTAKMEAKEQETPQADPFVETLKIALYGSYGSRKTLQIGWLIEAFGADNVFIVSAERGLNTIRSRVKRENVVVAASLTELRTAYGKAKEFATRNPTGWVAIDGGSQIAEWIANEQLSNTERLYELKVQDKDIPDALKPYGRFLDGRGQINTMAIYGRIGRDSENLLSAWISLPCNLYVNYLEDKTESNGFEKQLPYGPDVPGKIGLRAVMSSFDFVGRLMTKDGKPTAIFQPSNVSLARTREDRAANIKIPAEIPDFRLDNFVAVITSNATTN